MSQDEKKNTFRPGPIALFGSGEISPRGRKVYEYIFRRLPHSPHIALLETPAGFELNSAKVIGRVGEFLKHRLQNYDPQIEIVPARMRGTHFSPDNPNILNPLLNADLIFMGPGSPTYAIRQLRQSIAWHLLIAHHCLGGAIALASAATIAVSKFALPVYEIYKVGEDPHWKEGLDLFGLCALPLVFIPHWNNNDGGSELDTSRCFMGKPRFDHLLKMLPTDSIVIGIDELTGLIIEPALSECRVIGKGGVTLLRISEAIAGDADRSVDKTTIQNHAVHLHYFQEGETFPLSEIGSFQPLDPEAILPSDIWIQAVKAKQMRYEDDIDEKPSERVLELVNQRENARSIKDWTSADVLREEIVKMGWIVTDTPDGPKITKLEY